MTGRVTGKAGREAGRAAGSAWRTLRQSAQRKGVDVDRSDAPVQ